jgi:putative aldouronate transport system permease protein
VRKTSGYGNAIFMNLIYIFLSFIGFITLYPFWNILVLSLNDAIDSVRGGIYVWPRIFTWFNYQSVLSIESIATAFRNSILRTVLGVGFSLIATSMLAYVLTSREFVFRILIQRIVVVTMYVSGGLIPYYFVIKDLGLRNSFLVYLIPMLLNAFYVIIMRSFMDGLPGSVLESAKIDGANDFVIYLRIVIPMIRPALAAIGLFIAVDQWNSWFDTFIFVSNPNLTTLQYELVQILTQSTAQVSNIEVLRSQMQGGGRAAITTPESIRMAITIVATLPILFVYPFIQRFFVKGIALGAVKG